MFIDCGAVVSLFLLNNIENRKSFSSTDLGCKPMTSQLPKIVRDEVTEDGAKKDFKSELVIHFDINETCLIGDDAGGDTRQDCLNKIIAKSAFVRLPEGEKLELGKSLDVNSDTIQPTHWWDGSEIASTNQVDSAAIPPPMFTGWNWPKDCCPYYRTALKKRAKRFVEQDGWMYKALYDQLEKNVAVPRTDGVPEILSHMIPAFFATVREYHARSQTVRFVFRTFGSDLPDIAEAMTAFAKGKHPKYPDVNYPELVIDTTNLFRGRWADDGKLYQLWNHELTQVVASGDRQIMEFLEDKPICGIQDDYDFWNKKEYEPWAGKPVWVPHSSLCHHVLLDDNIHNLENDSIASVRKQESAGGEYRTLTGKEIMEQQGLHLIRVPTIEPVLNENWFVEQLDRAQLKFEHMHGSQSS